MKGKRSAAFLMWFTGNKREGGMRREESREAKRDIGKEKGEFARI